jgi:hypothetical protein
MGCNCKSGKATLNNLKSNDHLKLAYDFVRDTLQDKKLEDLDLVERNELLFVFSSLYPNASIKDNYDLMLNEVVSASQKYKKK